MICKTKPPAYAGAIIIFGQPSLSSKGKILYPHLFSLSRHLRSSFKVLACSLLLLSYLSIFLYFQGFSMVLSKRKRPHRTVFPLYKVFILFIPQAMYFCPLRIKGVALGYGEFDLVWVL